MVFQSTYIVKWNTQIFILLKGTEDLGWSPENYRYGFNTYIEGETLWI